YRSIWNESLGAWVAASENDSARGKPNKSAVAKAVTTAVLVAGATNQVAQAQYATGGGVASSTSTIAIGGNAAVLGIFAPSNTTASGT
ncbi:ESPR domain-containing protein, partial [Burkholderia gladioli]